MGILAITNSNKKAEESLTLSPCFGRFRAILSTASFSYGVVLSIENNVRNSAVFLLLFLTPK